MKHLMLHIIVLAVVMLPLAAPRIADAQPPAQWSRQALAVPPECTTRTKLDTGIPRAWVFIVNFRVAQAGCMLAYDLSGPDKFIGFKPMPDVCETVGDVRFFRGKAFFHGGYIKCQINIKDAVNDIVGRPMLTETAQLEGFYMIGRGVLSPTVAISPARSNLIMSYQPDNLAKPGVSMSVFVTSTQPNRAQILAAFNGNLHGSAECSVDFDNMPEQVWGVTRVNGQVKFWAGGEAVCGFPRPRIELWQDGGTFYIGGGPAGGAFLGWMEEAIMDPFDGSGPPGRLGNNPLEPDEGYAVFAPAIVR
jgi:hypothetical protein